MHVLLQGPVSSRHVRRTAEAIAQEDARRLHAMQTNDSRFNYFNELYSKQKVRMLAVGVGRVKEERG